MEGDRSNGDSCAVLRPTQCENDAPELELCSASDGNSQGSGVNRDSKRLKVLGEVLKEWRRRRCYGMTQILPRLFIGSLADAADLEQLRNNKITDVLSVHNLSRSKPALDTLNFLHIPLSDHPEVNIADYFQQSNSFIHRARIRQGSVLVHCLAGASRSVCLVAAYLITVTDMSYASTLAFISRKRPCANPNFGFRMQLVKFADKKVNAERIRLKNEFGASALKVQRAADANVLFGYSLTVSPSIPVVRSERNLSNACAPNVTRNGLHVDRINANKNSLKNSYKKSKSYDYLAPQPQDVQDTSGLLLQMSKFTFIDQ